MLVIVCVILLAGFLVYYYRRHPLTTKVIIGKTEFTADVAATPVEKAAGLGGREALEENRGMLFAFGNKDRHMFWMKGMNFALDYIWILDTSVVDISENVPVMTDGQITTLRPAVPVNKVFEVKAGTVARYGIRIGDPVRIEN